MQHLMTSKQQSSTMKDTSIKSVMTSDLITVQPNDTILKVDEIFSNNNFHHIPVINSANEVVGIISNSDYCMLYDSIDFLRSRFKENYQAERNQAFFKSLLVEEVMSKNLFTLNEEDSVSLAAQEFLKNNIHAIPITGANNKLKGILTTFDLIKLGFTKD